MARIMNLIVVVLALLFTRLCVGELQYASADDLEGVEAAVASDPDALAVVAFCVPWFEPCKSLSIELDLAQRRLKKWATIIQVNCDELPSVCSAHKIVSHPAIRVLRGKKERRYRGEFRAGSIISEVFKDLLPPVSKASRDLFRSIWAADTPLLLITHKEGEDVPGGSEALESIATSLQSKYFVMTTTDHGYSGYGEIAGPGIGPYVTVFNPPDEVKPLYQGPFDVASVVDFAEKVSTPLIARLDFSRLTETMKSGLPLAMIFAETDLARKELAEELMGTALEYIDKVKFATVNVQELSFLADALELDTNRYPAFVLQMKDDARTFDQDRKITRDAISEFLRVSLEDASGGAERAAMSVTVTATPTPAPTGTSSGSGKDEL